MAQRIGTGKDGADRDLLRVGAGDHRAASVQQKHDRGVVARGQRGEDRAHLVVEAERQAQGADHGAGIALPYRRTVEQAAPAAEQFEASERFDEGGARVQHGLHELAAGSRSGNALVQASEHRAIRA